MVNADAGPTGLGSVRAVIVGAAFIRVQAAIAARLIERTAKLLLKTNCTRGTAFSVTALFR